MKTREQTQAELGAQSAKQMADALNKMGMEDEFVAGFVGQLLKTHPTLQQRMGVLVLECIMAWAGNRDKGYMDGRNSAICNLSNDLRKVMRESNIVFMKSGRDSEDKEKVFLPFI